MGVLLGVLTFAWAILVTMLVLSVPVALLGWISWGDVLFWLALAGAATLARFVLLWIDEGRKGRA